MATHNTGLQDLHNRMRCLHKTVSAVPFPHALTGALENREASSNIIRLTVQVGENIRAIHAGSISRLGQG